MGRLQERFFWPKLYTDVKNFIEQCTICQKTSNPKRIAKIPLNPILPGKPLEIITTDIFGPLKVSKDGYKYVIAIIDHFTKWLELYALKKIENNCSNTSKVYLSFWNPRSEPL